MTLILFQTIIQSIGSTLHWLGFAAGIRSAIAPRPARWSWLIGSAAFALIWLIAIIVLASNDVFRNDLWPPRIPLALALTLAFGYLLLLSATFRQVLATIPQHWLIAIQAFRILGGIFLVRYAQGELPGVFALPAGIGDVATGLAAPLVAYWWYAGKPYARSAAIAWNLFGMADLINAVAIGVLIGGSGLVFPAVLIPIYAVPRAVLIHSYSLIGLLRNTSRQPTPQMAVDGLEALPSSR
jgi:hypothetical protein